MKLLAYLMLLAALLLFATSGILADEDPPEDDEGSAFDEPGEEEEKEREPFPATFPFKDYKVEMSVEDGRFWKNDKNFNQNEVDAKVLLKLTFKLPKSESPFDAIVRAQGWEHNLQFDFDGVKIKSDNYKKLCDAFYERDFKGWKDVKEPMKPKKIRLGRRLKAYKCALTGTPEGTSFPRRQESYWFKLGAKTYLLNVIYTTTAARSERITSEIEAMLKTIGERKTRRR